MNQIENLKVIHVKLIKIISWFHKIPKWGFTVFIYEDTLPPNIIHQTIMLPEDHWKNIISLHKIIRIQPVGITVWTKFHGTLSGDQSVGLAWLTAQSSPAGFHEMQFIITDTRWRERTTHWFSFPPEVEVCADSVCNLTVFKLSPLIPSSIRQRYFLVSICYKYWHNAQTFNIIIYTIIAKM